MSQNVFRLDDPALPDLASPGLSPLLYEELVERALEEDLGRAGDLTTTALIPPGQKGRAVIQSRTSGVVAGLGPALRAFAAFDPAMVVRDLVPDGTPVDPGTIIARLSGQARALLTGERTALNLLGHLGGIATRTRGLTLIVSGTKARITDTRKTLPGLRALQKYAVRCGGGSNHRLGLDDAVMIKDNHIAACGNLTEAVRRARTFVGHTVKIEVEVDTLDQLDELLEVGADIVLLDNLRGEDLGKAVKKCSGKILTEASGGITEANLRIVAESGVDIISLGALTHSVTNWDVGLDWEE